MPLECYSCTNCGFWQEYFAVPPNCPVCSDVRNALPENGWHFESTTEMLAREKTGEIVCEWREIDRDIWMFSNTPQLGIGSSGYLIVRSAGNIAFEAAGWYTRSALEQIKILGGIRFLSSSHPHGFGALWQLQREFAPETVAFHREAIRFTKAFDVNFAFDEMLQIDETAMLFYVGGHYEGQSVLYYAPRQILFAGDTLKFEADAGKTTGVSCHKAFHKQIPLSKCEIEKYQTVLSTLDFRQVCTPFEHTPDATTADARKLFETLLKSEKTFASPILVQRNMKAQEVVVKKDLDEVLETFQRAVPRSEAYEFELTSLDRLGIPLWGAFVWAEDGDFSDGFGYGADTLAARVSAWGEVLENYFSTVTLAKMPRRAASFNELKTENAVDPVSLCLDAGINYSSDKKIVWTSGKKYDSNEEYWLPIEAVAISPSDIKTAVAAKDLLFTPITNGLGAGASLEQALTHGILEQVQRDGDSVTFRAMDEGVKIELDAVETQETRNLLNFLDSNGIEVIPKLAGIVCGIPVIYVIGYDRNLSELPFLLSLSACGEAAHPDREIALSKALREFVSSRARKRFMHGSLEDMKSVAPAKYNERVLTDELGNDESRALQSVLDWTKMSREEFFETIKTPLFEVRSTVKFSNLPTVEPAEIDSATKLLNLLAARLKTENLEIFYADFTPPDSDFAVVKAIVAGLEVETMSYNRIGRRNLERLLERGKRESKFANLVGVGAAPENALPIHLETQDKQKIGGKAWLNPVEIERAVGKLYALYREPNGHTIGKVTSLESLESRESENNSFDSQDS